MCTHARTTSQLRLHGSLSECGQCQHRGALSWSRVLATRRRQQATAAGARSRRERHAHCQLRHGSVRRERQDAMHALDRRAASCGGERHHAAEGIEQPPRSPQLSGRQRRFRRRELARAAHSKVARWHSAGDLLLAAATYHGTVARPRSLQEAGEWMADTYGRSASRSLRTLAARCQHSFERGHHRF